MNHETSLDKLLEDMKSAFPSSDPNMERLKAEITFAIKFTELFPDKKAEWLALISKAMEIIKAGISSSNISDLIAQAERILSPIGDVAKQYTIHCCGHGHIDMNWLWSWPETVSVLHDTFSTVDRLMNEFPDFRFSQSQAHVYMTMEEYAPEIFEMIKRRMKEGRWESTASMWVEGGKNLASGESLCRHLLYTRRYFKDHFGLPYDAIKIDWSPDTFGHAHTLPAILTRGGVTRYYHYRCGPNKWLIWWKSPDGSRVLCFLDKATYNGCIEPRALTDYMLDYVRETSLKDFLFVYGVGDHGGGPTRRDLANAMKIAEWPIFPTLKLSTTDAYFTAVENSNPDLPVYDDELNFVFEGCYTSESNIKLANRVSENILPEAEAISIIARSVFNFAYPSELIWKGWRMAMFNQFHDILPGSGIGATYDYAQGLFQETQAIAASIRTRALRGIANRIDTSTSFGIEPPSGEPGDKVGDSIGAGAGDSSVTGGVSSLNTGAVGPEAVVVFNQTAFPRSAVVATKVWDKDLPRDRVSVRDDQGVETIGQVIETGSYWGHTYSTVIFPAKDIPGMGYRTYLIERVDRKMMKLPEASVTDIYPGAGYIIENADFPTPDDAVIVTDTGIMENEYIRVEVDIPSASIKHLILKSTGFDFVPEGELLGVLEYCQECPRDMSAWSIGDIQYVDRLQDGWFRIDEHNGAVILPEGGFDVWKPQRFIQAGPHRASILLGRKIADSNTYVEISLDNGSPSVNFKVTTDWREIGTKQTGVPMLRVVFPANLSDPETVYEIPFGKISRPTNGCEVPALRWADLSGKRPDTNSKIGMTLLNDCKYGHSADGNVLRLTLIRSSHEPDPVPEIGHHEVRFAVFPHEGTCPVSKATQSASAFNLPMNVVGTDIHKGELPGSKSFAEVLNPNVMLSALKKAEESDALILRIYETEGKDTQARIKLTDIVKPGSPAVEVDLMEQPLAKSSARMDDDILTVSLPACGISSVMIG